MIEEAELNFIMKYFGLSFGKCMELERMWALHGKKTISFILPMPKLEFRGMPIKFADINEPTVEIEA